MNSWWKPKRSTTKALLSNTFMPLKFRFISIWRLQCAKMPLAKVGWDWGSSVPCGVARVQRRIPVAKNYVLACQCLDLLPRATSINCRWGLSEMKWCMLTWPGIFLMIMARPVLESGLLNGNCFIIFTWQDCWWRNRGQFVVPDFDNGYSRNLGRTP